MRRITSNSQLLAFSWHRDFQTRSDENGSLETYIKGSPKSPSVGILVHPSNATRASLAFTHYHHRSNGILIVRLFAELVAHLVAVSGPIRPFCGPPFYQLLRQSQQRRPVQDQPTAVYGIPIRGTLCKLPQPHRAVNAVPDICAEVE